MFTIRPTITFGAKYLILYFVVLVLGLLNYAFISLYGTRASQDACPSCFFFKCNIDFNLIKCLFLCKENKYKFSTPSNSGLEF